MNDDATKIVNDLLETELIGAAVGVLRKYHLMGEDGKIRNVRLGTGRKLPNGEEELEPPGPIINPEVIDRFMVLDPSKSKRVFDWMIFASGGGEPARRGSERALELAHNWVLDNRMKGLDRNEQEIKPMTREEAEADWKAHSLPQFFESYYYADQDLAKDPQYPVFGWYREWPGRNSVYAKVVEAVTKWNALIADKRLLAQYNKIMPNEPFQTNMWDEQGKPRYQTAEELLNVAQKFKTTFARRKAEKNVVFIGKSKDPAKPGYVRGSDEVLYDDDIMTVVIPATAAASMKKGAPNWCVANKTRWDDYFNKRDKSELRWGDYSEDAPFAYWLFKPKMGDPYLQKIAGHLKCGNRMATTPREIEFWDVHNQKQKSYEDITGRLESTLPGSKAKFDASLKEVMVWLAQHKKGDLEHYPALENLANKLVDAVLS